MTSENRKKFIRVLLMAAAVTAVVCLVILIFFRTDAASGCVKAVLGLLTPFIYGFAIAYVLRPLALFFEKYLGKLAGKLRGNKTGKKTREGGGTGLRLASVLLALAVFAVIVAGLIMMVLPEVISSIRKIISGMPAAVESFRVWLTSMDTGGISHEIVVAVENAVSSAAEQVNGFLSTSILPNLNSLVSNVTSSLMNIFSFLKNFGLGFIISAYFLAAWEKFRRQAGMMVRAIFPPRAALWIFHEARYANKMFSGFINGKILDSAIIGILCFIFVSLTGMPYSVLISLVVGMTNIIPFFGPFLGAVPSVLLILTVSPMKAIVFLIFVIVLQQFDGNILGPKILGDRLGISSFWILFSIIVFGSLFGVLGMIIGAPLFAVIYDIVRKWVKRQLKTKYPAAPNA